MAFKSLPVINIAPFLARGSLFRDKQLVADQLHEACKNVGFFYLTGHGVADAVRLGAGV